MTSTEALLCFRVSTAVASLDGFQVFVRLPTTRSELHVGSCRNFGTETGHFSCAARLADWATSFSIINKFRLAFRVTQKKLEQCQTW